MSGDQDYRMGMAVPALPMPYSAYRRIRKDVERGMEYLISEEERVAAAVENYCLCARLRDARLATLQEVRERVGKLGAIPMAWGAALPVESIVKVLDAMEKETKGDE